MFDKNKVYGCTPEEAEATWGMAMIENYHLTKVEPDQELTYDEIIRMFPEQYVYLVDVKYDNSGKQNQNHIVSGKILYYQCSPSQAIKLYSARGNRPDETFFINMKGRLPIYGYNEGEDIY